MKKTRRYKKVAKDSKPAENKKVVANDSFSNPLARLGYGTPNLLDSTEYPITRLTQNFTLLNSMYRSHWIARKVIDTIPEDAMKNWIELETQLEPDELKRIDIVVRKTKLKRDILKGLKLGRLYGGAAGIIIIDGHENMLDQPLDYDTILPGSFKGLIIGDRWQGISPDIETIEDVTSPDFGLPEYYHWTTDHFAQKVHCSRVVRFVGGELPPVELATEMNWGLSEIEIVIDELKKRDNVSLNIAQLTFMANLSVFKLDGLGELMAVGDATMQTDLYNSLTLQNMLKNNMSAIILGKDDEFQNYSYSFAGINDIYESFMMDVSGATGIPVTKLFGRAPAGLNSTGEGDMQNYYNLVEQYQDAHLSPVIDKLLPIIMISELGSVPDDLDYSYNPMETPSDDDLANIVDKKANTIINAFNAGLISQKTGMMELRQMADSTGMFTNITDEDIESADSEIDKDIGDMPSNNNGFIPYGNDEDTYGNSFNFKLPSSDNKLPTFDGGPGSGRKPEHGNKIEEINKNIKGKNDNDLADNKLFKEMKNILGNEMPNTIEEFKKLKYNDSNKLKDLQSYYEYKKDNHESNKTYYNINKNINELIDKGIVSDAIGTASKPVQVKFETIHKHAAKRMRKRNVTVEDARGYIQNSKIMFKQNSGQKNVYYSEEGVATVVVDEKLLVTVFSKDDYDNGAKAIMEVANKYGI